MSRLISVGLLALALLSTLWLWGAQPAAAQLILASGTYRVTELSPDKERVGIAQMDANPNVTQNWVYLKLQKKSETVEDISVVLEAVHHTDRMVEKAIEFIIENSVLPRIDELQRSVN